MSEDARTLWVGNLHKDVTDELVYELFLQTGPLEKLIFPTEGDGDEKKNKGIAYVLFKHPESVAFAKKVLEGTTLFGSALEMKVRSMPHTYRSTAPSSGGPVNNNSSHSHRYRHDNSSLRGGFNRTNTWHGREDFVPRGRGGGGYRHKGPSNHNQNSNNSYNQGGGGGGGYNYNNQINTGYWMSQQQQQQQQQQPQSHQMSGGESKVSSYSNPQMEEKRQRILQQQNLSIQGQNQNQQTTQQQQQQQQQPQQQQYQQDMMNPQQQMYMQHQQQTWDNTGYSTVTTSYTGQLDNSSAWSGMDASSMYQSYGDQYNTWYQQQQQQQ